MKYVEILAQTGGPTETNVIADAILTGICVLGTVILAVWLVRDRGPLALAASPVRRNRLPLVLPPALLGLWVFLTILTQTISALLSSWTTPVIQTLVQYGLMMIAYLFLIALMLTLAYSSFARGLGGLGFRRRTIFRDFGIAVVNLLAVYPLVLLAVSAVVSAGDRWAGPDFQFQQNPALKDMLESQSQIQIVALAVFAVLVVPVFEELMFRGMIQTTLRSYLARPWPAILITSALFAVLHPFTHWPALFILGCAFGYAYERSGSLLRAIFLHALFNAANVVASRGLS